MNPSKTQIITDWDRFLPVIIQKIQRHFPATRTKGKTSKQILIFTDKDRKDEVIKFFNIGSTYLKKYTGKVFQLTKELKPSRSKTTETITIRAGETDSIDIVFKPFSSFRGAGKENELAFMRLVEMAKADSTTELSSILRFTDGIVSAPDIYLTPNTPITLNTKNNKADIVVGPYHISLKDETADYVASLNNTDAETAHYMIRSLVEMRGEDAISYNGDTITINKDAFPFKHIGTPTKREFVLFGTGSTTAGMDVKDVAASTNRAHMVLIGNFRSPKDVKGVILYDSGQSPDHTRHINKILNKESDATGKYDIFYYLRNAQEKGQAFNEKIRSYKELDAWMTRNPHKVPKGVRLLATFENKIKRPKDVEIT